MSQLLHEHHTDLLDLPNSDNKSIGEVNPTLTRSMATAVSPYLAEMVGVPGEDTGTHGFGVLGKENVPALYATLASDPEAAEHLAGRVTETVASLEQRWISLEPTSGNPRLEYGTWSGSLLGAAEAGVRIEHDNRVQDIEDRGTLFDTTKAGVYGAASAIPVVGPLVAIGVDMLAPSMREDYVDTSNLEPHAAPDTSRFVDMCNLALAIQEENGGVLPDGSQWDPFKTEAGNLGTLAQVESDRPDRSIPVFISVVTGELNVRGIPIDGFNTAVDDGGRSVTEG